MAVRPLTSVSLAPLSMAPSLIIILLNHGASTMALRSSVVRTAALRASMCRPTLRVPTAMVSYFCSMSRPTSCGLARVRSAS